MLYSSYKKSQKVLKNGLTLMLYNDWTESGASFIFSSIIQNKREVSKSSSGPLVYQVARLWRKKKIVQNKCDKGWKKKFPEYSWD